jgi:hypothetical protein
MQHSLCCKVLRVMQLTFDPEQRCEGVMYSYCLTPFHLPATSEPNFNHALMNIHVAIIDIARGGTGNDFSTLYAPLIRDGRMEKYYWNPTREDRIGVCFGIFKDDNLDRSQIEYLVDTFPGQSIDFFGALRARVYDNAVREFIESKGLDGLGRGVLVSERENFEFPSPSMDLVCLPPLPNPVPVRSRSLQ